MTAVTLAQMRQACRLHLGDTSLTPAFSDDQLNQWINEAIAAYSMSFPRKKTEAIYMVPNQFFYNLPLDFHHVLSVQYSSFSASFPADPPEYFVRRPYKHPDFWREDGYYDIFKRQEESVASQLIISRNPPSANDAISLGYDGDHEHLALDADISTVPYRHLPLLYQFVRWCSLQQLAISAAVSPSVDIPLSPYEEIAALAHESYQRMLDHARDSESETTTSEWKMDKWDRGY